MHLACRIILLLCIGSTLATDSQIEDLPIQPTGITFGPPTPSTEPTPKPTTAPPTTKPTTASTTTKSTTSATTTTTSTTPASTTSSTTKPTTSSTTTAKPTPTPKPGKPEVNKFIGNYTGKSYICLMAQMAIQVEINVDKNNTVVMNIPKQPQNEIICPANDFETLTIKWESNNITFNFLKNKTSYEIQNVTANIVLPGDNSSTLLWHTKPEFQVSTKQSYLCVKDQALNLTDSKNASVARLHLSHLQYQAFMNTTEPEYSAVWDCEGANTSDVVPVVVGCVLAIMVVLILIAYLFGRRRCQARGYLSMFAQERSERDYIPMKTLSCFK
ncbi:lysosome-associated membrane glycoprotein 1-like [Anthonomus grandis grandis]|uniref:lysosome-associated membrane glycoprotein 1-like n=1 Tax=Anthonomus grandis grandis TaxID=2921223 RepID=UPI0021660F6C|nr:lysosome-associated membrane glycoprotein 1-like [Anthonomus grandis grandis]